jgi:hypothetical protein
MVKIGVGLILICCATFILSRPSPRPVPAPVPEPPLP